MDDLISRQEAINALIQKSLPVHNEDGTTTITLLTDRIIQETLEALPSAEPEIIRCKDCKYGSPNGTYGCKAYHYKLYETHEMEPDDFCSRAERRTDE